MNLFSLTPTYDNSFFWEATKNRELKFQKCRECGFVRWPPSISCPKCYSMDFDYVVSKGVGRVYSFVVYRVAFHEAFKERVPYVVAIVELEEGPSILTNIINCDPSSLECGMQVRLVWEEYGDFNLFKFEPLTQ